MKSQMDPFTALIVRAESTENWIGRPAPSSWEGAGLFAFTNKGGG
jgi:hypothetical protein